MHRCIYLYIQLWENTPWIHHLKSSFGIPSNQPQEWKINLRGPFRMISCKSQWHLLWLFLSVTSTVYPFKIWTSIRTAIRTRNSLQLDNMRQCKIEFQYKPRPWWTVETGLANTKYTPFHSFPPTPDRGGTSPCWRAMAPFCWEVTSESSRWKSKDSVVSMPRFTEDGGIIRKGKEWCWQVGEDFMEHVWDLDGLARWWEGHMVPDGVAV